MRFIFGENRLHLFTWLTGIFFIFYISGFDSDYVNYLISAAMVFLLGGYFLLRRRNFTQNVFKAPAFKSFFVFILIYFYYLSVADYSVAQFVFAQLILLFPMTVYLFYENDKDQLYGILWFVIAAWIVFGIRAWYMYSNDLVSARSMAAHLVDENVLTGGGYGFAVGSAVLAVFSLEMLLWGNVKKHKFLTFAFVIMLCLVVMETRSTITILALFFGLFSALFFKLCNIKTLKKIGFSHMLFLIIVILLIVLFFVYKEDLGEFILNRTRDADDIISRRIREIGVYLTRNETLVYGAEDMSDRMDRLSSSWSLFLENPIFGITYKYGANSYILSYFNLGSHGEFLDILAKYGLAGGLPYLLMFYFTLLHERRMQKNKIGFGYLVVFSILFFFNPFIYFQSTTVIFFVLPAVTKLFNSEDENAEEEIEVGKS